jgi:heptosyltransferase III
MKILIARTDNIGDVVLTLPLAGLIKKHQPHAKVYFLVRSYVLPIAQTVSEVDQCLDWDTLKKQSKEEAIKALKKENFDFFINVSTDSKVAQMAKKAGIPKRIATAHRLHHWFYCNALVFFSRKNTVFHEMELNTQLLKPLNIKSADRAIQLLDFVSLHPPQLTKTLSAYLKKDCFNLLVHPGSNGNGREWPIKHFISLIQQLPKDQFHILITGGPNEIKISQALQNENVIDLTGKTNLNELYALTAHADGLIASGTGPLHLAASLGIHTLGLYPPKKSAGIERWGAVGKKAESLVCQNIPCLKACSNQSCSCMEALTPTLIKEKMLKWVT